MKTEEALNVVIMALMGGLIGIFLSLYFLQPEKITEFETDLTIGTPNISIAIETDTDIDWSELTDTSDISGTFEESLILDEYGTFIQGITFSTTPALVITSEGQMVIDDIPVERFSDPEIKEAMKSIAKSMQENSIISHYSRQADMLLLNIGILTDKLRECENK